MDNWVDVVSLIVSIVTAALVPGVYWLYKRWAERRQRIADEMQRAKDADAERLEKRREDALAKRTARQDKHLAEVERKQGEYNELKEIFAIHSALTQLDAYTALARARAHDGSGSDGTVTNVSDAEAEAAKLFLISLHFRTTSQFTRLQENVAVPQGIIDKIDELQGAIASQFPEETRAVQEVFTEQSKRIQGHEKNPEVQARVREIAKRFVGRDVEPDTVVEVSSEFGDLFRSLRITRAGQGISFTLPDTEASIWFAGSGQGVVPATVEHATGGDLHGCSLRSRKRGSLLTQLQQIDAAAGIAEGLADGIRSLASENENLCGCGVKLVAERAGRAKA